MVRKKIALVTGGYSGEAQVSYKSAGQVEKNLDGDKFDVYVIDINPQGWFYMPQSGEKQSVNKENFTVKGTDGSVVYFDAVLICVHGTPGEDGRLQGYLDLLQIPYTSCDAATSALTFNKRYTVSVAAFSGINVAKSKHLFKHTPVKSSEVLDGMKLPLFVKPNNGGSSIGMSKVLVANQLDSAIEKAFNEDDQVLVEEFVEGREFTIGIFKSKGKIIALPITEIISDNAFFDFEAKYLGKSKEVTPAVINGHMENEIKEAAIKAYEVFNCRGVVRIDFIYNEVENAPYMIEINTVPGQSEASIVPQQVRAMGWSLKEFYTAMLDECFA